MFFCLITVLLFKYAFFLLIITYRGNNVNQNLLFYTYMLHLQHSSESHKDNLDVIALLSLAPDM